MSITQLGPTVMRPDRARAMQLLADDRTANDAAAETGLKLSTVSQAARRLGWTIHGTTYLAQDLTRDDGKPVLPDGIAAQWTPKPRIVTDPGEPTGSVDRLLADARLLDDTKVQAALRRAETAVTKLREVYTETSERIEAAAVRQAEQQTVLDKVAALEQQLAAAREQVKELGVTTRAGRRRTSDGPGDAEIRTWAQRNGIPCSERGRVKGTVRLQYIEPFSS
ncbi:hypothetical protein Ppa06_69880 [Planomonospora parontospora subsp. parontospora]|uniref:Lsr2 DNA-binding domain-containing protein n=2 Tax=Planomonospora parontospora TaxID=58119 RepID=A0AA37F8F6_9ACTN|nr:histone-like nucleoid-structuring protein Lsr2 [Planomonospora parontospora]GGL01300.1 hypothetical protein GCM10010126_70690 [Planomonospora parontospora]GII13190.1 hypothetical protein Ppa06_69880 [Planomonospora parontospora subsp. parontospora]